MKKVLTILVLAVFIVCSVFAGDFKFLFTELDQHPEILIGFLPTLTSVGVSYEGLELVEGDLTQLQATIGGGYTQKMVFLDPVTGIPLNFDQLIYDSIQVRWNLKFLQGFGDSWVPGKDLITAYAGYEGRWEKNVDSMAVGEEKMRGYSNGSGVKGPSLIPKMDAWKGGALASSTVYPDLANNKVFFGTILYAGAKLNLMEDKQVTLEGATAEAKIQIAPGFINKEASYYSLTLNGVAGTTLLEYQDSHKRNLFSVVLIDRVNLNWTDGKKLPVYAQSPVSLGRKVRGFNTNTYNTNFSVVNNLDLRLAGPEPLLDGIFPRVNLFFDMGYHSGKYFNTNVEGNHFLCSAGAQFTVSFFDFIDLGYQLSYLIKGTNLRQPEEKLITSFTFFLDF